MANHAFHAADHMHKGLICSDAALPFVLVLCTLGSMLQEHMGCCCKRPGKTETPAAVCVYVCVCVCVWRGGGGGVGGGGGGGGGHLSTCTLDVNTEDTKA